MGFPTDIFPTRVSAVAENALVVCIVIIRCTSGGKKPTELWIKNDLLLTDSGDYMAHPNPIWPSHWGEKEREQWKDVGESDVTGVQGKGA